MTAVANTAAPRIPQRVRGFAARPRRAECATDIMPRRGAGPWQRGCEAEAGASSFLCSGGFSWPAPRAQARETPPLEGPRTPRFSSIILLFCCLLFYSGKPPNKDYPKRLLPPVKEMANRADAAVVALAQQQCTQA